jgi:putative transposase
MSSIKAFKYRLYPNKKQAAKLQETLDWCRRLYNAALQERRDAYELKAKRHAGYYDAETRQQLTREHALTYERQAAELPEIKEVEPAYAQIHSQVLQDVLRRVKKAYDHFFRRVKEGKTPGYPRFQGYGRYHSFTYPQSGFSLTPDHHVYLSKIGTLKVKFPTGKKAHPPTGIMKTCTIKREGQHWYVVFTCEVEQELVYHPCEESVGIDLGLLHFATLSTGEQIENPRHLRRMEERLKKQQQELARKKRGSTRRRKAGRQIGKIHQHIRNQRRDFHHKQARQLVTRYGILCFEDLKPANMSRRPKPKQDETTGQYLPNGASAKAGLNKSIRDAGWGQFVRICEGKAESAGARVLKVNPRNTSQRCSQCGAMVPKGLEERWHSCPSCGAELDRDHNSALDVLRLGLEALAFPPTPKKRNKVQARTEPSGDALLRSPGLSRGESSQFIMTVRMARKTPSLRRSCYDGGGLCRQGWM